MVRKITSKKNAIVDNTLINLDAKEYFTESDFTAIYELNKGYVRQMCSKQRGLHLPDEYYAIPPRKGYLIKKKKASVLNTYVKEGSNINPAYLEDLNTFCDFDSEIDSCMALLMISLPNKCKFLIYNSLDHAQKEKYVFLNNYLGENILYKLFSKIQNELSSSILSNYSMLIIRWLIISGITIPLRLKYLHDSTINGDSGYDFCSYCGKHLPINKKYSSNQIRQKNYLFCCKEHKDDFNKDSFLIKELVSYRESFAIIYTSDSYNKIEPDFHHKTIELIDNIFERFTRLIQRPKKMTLGKEIKTYSKLDDVRKEVLKLFNLKNETDITFKRFDNFIQKYCYKHINSVEKRNEKIEGIIDLLANDTPNEEAISKIAVDILPSIQERILANHLKKKSKKKIDDDFYQKFIESHDSRSVIHYTLISIMQNYMKSFAE